MQRETPAATVSTAEVRELLAGAIIEDARIQESYSVGGRIVSPTQLFYALSYLYVLDRHGVDTEVIDIPATLTAPSSYFLLETLGCADCLDSAWSPKPARFQPL